MATKRDWTVPLEHVHHLPDPNGDPHERYARELERTRLQRELEALPSLERRVLELRYGLEGEDDHSIRQIALRLCMSIGRVFYVEQSALARLRCAYGLEPAPVLALASTPALAVAA